MEVLFLNTGMQHVADLKILALHSTTTASVSTTNFSLVLVLILPLEQHKDSS